MNSFYVTLPSDSSMDIFPSNTQCCFKVKLPQILRLQKEFWEVALVEMIIPSQIANVLNDEAYFDIVILDKSLYNDVMELPSKDFHEVHNTQVPFSAILRFEFLPGSYSSPSKLLDTIDDIIQKQFGELFEKKSRVFGVKYSKVGSQPKLVTRKIKNIGLRFSPGLYFKLGGADVVHEHANTMFPYRKAHNFAYNSNLDIGFNQLFIYSNVVEYTIVGHIQAPILRVVPYRSINKKLDSHHIHHEFLNSHYIPVSKSEFDILEINIRGDTGKPVQFVGGKSMVKLHFRKRKQ